ncbi:hypothetical protein PMAYCL1PPCAC_15025, partial [Pristionchus mayeri]
RTILALTSSIYAFSTIFANCLIIIAIIGRRTSDHRGFSFYVIYMVGGIIDVIALTSVHLLDLLPSKGFFLDFFLSSTAVGRIWSLWCVRTLCVIVQFSFGISVGIYAASREVYWFKTAGGNWYIQIIYYGMYSYGFIMNTNFTV